MMVAASRTPRRSHSSPCARKAACHSALARLPLRKWVVCTLLLITVLMGPNGFLTNLSVAYAQNLSTQAQQGKPNPFDPRQHTQSTIHLPHKGSSDPNWKPHPPQPLLHPFTPSMKPGSLILTPGKAVQFLGSDGRLEVDVPASAITSSALTQAGGRLLLQITQIAPASGSTAGGSGHLSLGTYLLQVVDAHGKRATQPLQTPITLKWHYGKGERGLDLAHTFVVFNGLLPAGAQLVPTATGKAATLDAQVVQQATLDQKQQTLSVTTASGTTTTSASFNTFSPVATFGAPDPFTVSLNAGALTFADPIDLPPGPGGFTPPVSLTYSSEAVSEQHDYRGAAPWVGEGWNLSLGVISWAEHNMTPPTPACLSTSTCSNIWENTWRLTDPFGTSAELIPPDIDVTWSPESGVTTPNPITWQTAPATHVKVISFDGPVTLNGSSAPCFRVFLPNGVMEEFGCTPDSLQYYLEGVIGPDGPTSRKVPTNWYLDLITDRNGNQIHLTYQRDMTTVPWIDPNTTYPRDVVLSTIEYDSPGCQNSQVACNGSDWAPLMRVSFVASHAPARLTNTPSRPCNSDPTLRCDDPEDLTSSEGPPAPMIQHTYVLNDLKVQVRPNGGASWNTLQTYQFSYEHNGPLSDFDPLTFQLTSQAGMLDLTQIRVIGDDGTTALPTRVFSYTTLTERYVDSTYQGSLPDCGPAWNTACLLWNTSSEGSSRYLATADNGQGLQQTFTWNEAHNNTHGVVGGGTNTADPFYCNGSQAGLDPCNRADDQAWSHATLIREQSSVLRVAQNGQGGQQISIPVDSITAFSYRLAYPLVAQPCSDCVAGMYWGNQKDLDYLDYFNYQFMGFALAWVSHPDGSVEVHHYYATEGIGVYDSSQITCSAPNPPCHQASWWDLPNAAHGHEYKVDSYDTDGTTLLSQTLTQYRVLCPPSGVGGTPSSPDYGNWNGNLVSEFDPENPVASCDIQTTQVDSYTSEGASGSSQSVSTASADFSGTQGQGQWMYQDSTDGVYFGNMTYDTTHAYWYGPESTCLIGSNWQSAGGNVCRAVRTWVASKAALVTISANGSLSAPSSCTGAVSIQVRKNGVTIWPTSGSFTIPPGGVATFPTLAISVSAGDHLQFFEERGVTCQLTWDPVVSFPTGSVIHQATSYTYDSYGRVITTQAVSDDGGSPGSPSSITTHTAYVWNDAVTATATSATGTYLIAFPAYTYTVDGSGNRAKCAYTSYDGLTDEIGPQSNFTGQGLATETDAYPTLNATTCGYQASLGFSGTQGQNQWRYQYSNDWEQTIHDMTYDSVNALWRGNMTNCQIWANGQHPNAGSFTMPGGCSSIRTWVAPSAGIVTLSANGPITLAAACGNASDINIQVLKNGTQIWPSSGWQAISHGSSITFPTLTTSVAAGDQIHFVEHAGQFDNCDATTWDPQVDFGAAGGSTTPDVSIVPVPPLGTPGTSYQAAQGYSATQGQNQWQYQGSTNGEVSFLSLTYDSGTGWWRNGSSNCIVASNWQHPQAPCDSSRTWVAPGSGTVLVTTNGPITLANNCGTLSAGVQIRLLKNGKQIWPASGWQILHHGDALIFPNLMVAVATGDQLHFVLAQLGSSNACDTTTWDPQITYLGSTVPVVETSFTYDGYGNPLTTTDPDANAGNTAHTGCTIGGSTVYTTCVTYDTTFHALPTSATNALNQTASTSYTQTASGGFGLWPTSITDVNGQTTTTSYDALGRMISQTLPGETSGLTTTSTTYTDFCAASGAQAPCLEVDQTERLDDTTTVVSRAFYDGEGHLVETRTPGPDGQDVVQYTYYDPSGRDVLDSIQYFVAAYTGGPGAAAYSIPDSNQPRTTTTYTNLRTTTGTDALSNATTSRTSVVCSAAGTGDGACYLQMLVIDPLGHQSSTLSDAFGRKVYAQDYTGHDTSTYAVYATTRFSYDGQGNLTQILHPDGVTTTTFQYDGIGRQLGIADSDRGIELALYDANGNVLASADARGTAGIIYAGYDALNRQLWRNTSGNPTGAYVTYTYDGTVPAGVSCSGIDAASNALGQVTTEQFTSGPTNSFSGAYCYGYDARGEQVGEVDTLAGTTFAPILTTYNDAGMPLQLTYPTSASVSNHYSNQGWLASITRSMGGTTDYLVPAITYQGAAGAAGLPTSYVLGGSGSCSIDMGSSVCTSLSYDGDLRLTQATYTTPTSSTPITDYSLGVTYDAVGNITSLSSALPAAGGQSGGQDNQQFCYDEQDRLTWAGTTDTAPCTGQAVTGTTLTAASYTASYQYDAVGRITQSTLTGALSGDPQGTYTYDSQHLHAVAAIGSSGYTAQYDAAGDMTCRAPTGSHFCTSGSQTGAHLTYDVEGRLIEWVSADGATTVMYGYDGEGQRVEMQVTSGGTTTTTTYVGDLEEVQEVNDAPITITDYFYWGGQPIAEEVAGHRYYLLTDHLTSTTVAVDATGVIAAQLFGPYGQGRWAGGTMPTSYAFTGQRADSATGLDYYYARYYDPQAGRFTSADTVLAGLDSYAYVGGNPIAQTDPSGHCAILCSILIGAVLGGVIDYGSQVISNLENGQDFGDALTHVNVGEILLSVAEGAAFGLIGFGATTLLNSATTALAAGGAPLALRTAAQILSGPAAGALTGLGGQVLINGITGEPLDTNLGQATLFGAITGGLGTAVQGALRWLGGRILKYLVNKVNTEFADSYLTKARQYMVGNQYPRGQTDPAFAQTVYGTALEKAVGERIEQSPIWSRLFKYQGASQLFKPVPDFEGRGPFAGFKYDITTNTTAMIRTHLTRTYGKWLGLVLYKFPEFPGIPPGSVVFP